MKIANHDQLSAHGLGQRSSKKTHARRSRDEPLAMTCKTPSLGIDCNTLGGHNVASQQILRLSINVGFVYRTDS